jgi:GNAT superfamily N-acetyltransferase
MSKLDEGLTLRLARPEEHDELEDLQRRASLEVPEIDGEIVGFAAVVGGELDGLFVEPDLWGFGVGRRLVDAATNEARRRGLALKVIASPRGRRFYEHCGFTVEGEAQTRFGPALRMTK